MHALLQEEHGDYLYTYKWKTAVRVEMYSDSFALADSNFEWQVAWKSCLTALAF